MKSIKTENKHFQVRRLFFVSDERIFVQVNVRSFSSRWCVFARETRKLPHHSMLIKVLSFDEQLCHWLKWTRECTTVFYLNYNNIPQFVPFVSILFSLSSFTLHLFIWMSWFNIDFNDTCRVQQFLCSNRNVWPTHETETRTSRRTFHPFSIQFHLVARLCKTQTDKTFIDMGKYQYRLNGMLV